eukprot:g20705.t1
MGIRSWMDDSSFRWLQETSKQEGFSVDAAANGWFGLYFDYSSKMSSKHGVAHFFEEARESGGYASFCIGCDAFVRNDAEKWAEQVKENLAPIGSKTNELVKGPTCPFAHGEHELRGGAPEVRDQGKQKDAEVMCWLKEQREQGGVAAEDFEKRWLPGFSKQQAPLDAALQKHAEPTQTSFSTSIPACPPIKQTLRTARSAGNLQ